MGEYWKPVNVTKREYIHPHDMNDGLKLPEWNHPNSRTRKLMSARWDPADVVIAVSDYDGLLGLQGDPANSPSREFPTYDSIDEDGYQRVRRVGK